MISTVDLPTILAAVLEAPRRRTLATLSHELQVLLPHEAAVMLTGACERAPLQSVGPVELTRRITTVAAFDLLHPESGERPDSGQLADPVGMLRTAGGPVQVIALSSTSPPTRGAGLLLLRAVDAAPVTEERRRDARLVFDVVATALADRNNGERPEWSGTNRDVASVRGATRDRAAEAHAATLTGMLSTLRSGGVDDASARRTVTDLASQALVDLRRGSEVERRLTSATALVTFDELRRHGERLVGDLPLSLDWLPPTRDLPWGQDVAQTALAVSRAALTAAVEGHAPTRLRLAWMVEPARLQVELRSDTDRPFLHSDAAVGLLENLVSTAGGSLSTTHDAVWGATLGASLPTSDSGGPRDGRHSGLLATLTGREREVLTAVADGLSNQQVARALSVSQHTVKYHVHNLLRKLGVPSRSAAAALAREAGHTPTPR